MRPNWTTHFNAPDPTSKSLEAALLDQKVAGAMGDLSYAYVAVVGGSKQFTIGIAVEGQDGYNPIDGGLFEFDSYDEANVFCDGMNKHIGLDKRRAIEIICTTMRGSVQDGRSF
jgi:hypothetical protein